MYVCLPNVEVVLLCIMLAAMVDQPVTQAAMGGAPACFFASSPGELLCFTPQKMTSRKYGFETTPKRV